MAAIQQQRESEDGIDEETNEQVELDEGDVFEVLSNQRRRYTFHYLKSVERRPVDTYELTNHVAAWEYDKEPRAVTAEERNRVSTALRQFHLPKMDNAGFVEYDRQRGEAVLREEAADLEVYLDVVPTRDVPWSWYYLGLATVHTGLLVAAGTNVGPFASLSGYGVAAFVVATLAVSAVAHAYYSRTQRYGETESPPGVDEP
jgi:hypothetical protein